MGWLAVASSLALALLAPASAVSAASVTPVFLSGAENIDCAALDNTYGGDQTWLEFKLQGDDLANGTYTVPSTGTITISNFTPSVSPAAGSFDWTSTFGIDAVLVKTGVAGKNLYVYAPTSASAESFGDTNLVTPTGQGNGFSHITFCYDVTNPTPTATPTSTPPATEPPTATPTSTPPATEPPTATPTATPPATEPPATEPPATEPPATEPPATEPPGGDILGETGTPRVTLPPTSTIDGGSTPNTDSWRFVLVGFAAIMAGMLVLTPGDRKVRNRR